MRIEMQNHLNYDEGTNYEDNDSDQERDIARTTISNASVVPSSHIGDESNTLVANRSNRIRVNHAVSRTITQTNQVSNSVGDTMKFVKRRIQDTTGATEEVEDGGTKDSVESINKAALSIIDDETRANNPRRVLEELMAK